MEKCYGEPKRARNWKRWIQPRQYLQVQCHLIYSANLRKYPPVGRATGGRNEVNDEGEEKGSGNRRATISESAEEGQRDYPE
jgi:hypothetical protein